MTVAIVTAVNTACGIVSRSETQTGWAVETARRRIRIHQPDVVSHLTDDDIVWLLVMGWAP